MDSGYLTEGPVTREFETVFKNYVGAAHALAVCNCTVGLEVALRALCIGPGDEVIVPDYTYPATASVVDIVGATTVLEAEVKRLVVEALDAKASEPPVEVMTRSPPDPALLTVTKRPLP